MGQTTLSVRLDDDVKRRFDYICSDIGMNASVAVNVFIRAVLRNKGIPFEVISRGMPPAKTKPQKQNEAIKRFFADIDAIDDEPITDEDVENLARNRVIFNKELAL